MEHNLDAIVTGVEQLHAADLVQDRIVRVVGHVVRRDRGKRVALERKDAAFEEDLVFFREELCWCWDGFLVSVGTLARVSER